MLTANDLDDLEKLAKAGAPGATRQMRTHMETLVAEVRRLRADVRRADTTILEWHEVAARAGIKLARYSGALATIVGEAANMDEVLTVATHALNDPLLDGGGHDEKGAFCPKCRRG